MTTLCRYGGLAVLATGLMESVKKEQRDKPDDFDDDAIEAELAVAVPTVTTPFATLRVISLEKSVP
jgi:hypothetical protein